MTQTRIIELKESILEDNDQDAEALRDELKEQGRFYINIMSSPGSGKTSTLLALIPALQAKLPAECGIGVMEADIDSAVDADTVLAAGIPAVQLHTGGMCHLDAQMSRQGMEALPEEVKVIFLENVGNLVCPAEFDTGAHMDICILSVPEGEDKPLKYPLMFERCGVVLINKIDALPAFSFSIGKAAEGIYRRNEEAKIFPISAKTGEGIEAVANYLAREIQKNL